jgi:hypothetical protein
VADIFTLDELGTLTGETDTARLDLSRQLATILIRNEVGATRYDALTDLSPFKPLAMEVASRALPPRGVRSEAIDDYRVTYSDSGSALDLTDAERAQIAVLLGRSRAFSIVPAAPLPMCPPVYPPMPWRRSRYL